MWLPKAERKLLACLYREIGKPGVKARLFLSKLQESTACSKVEVELAAKILDRRKLIALMPSQGDAITVSLVVEGYDLGRKYSSKLHTFLLLCNEYKVWIILGLIISFVGVLIAILKD